MEYQEFTGKTVEEAVTSAVAALGTTSDMLDYEVVENGSSGFLGLGRKDAMIRARLKDSPEIRARNFLDSVFKVMNMDVELEIKVDDETHFLSINMKGNNMGVLIGKRGQTLDSLQYLTNLVVNKNVNVYYKIRLDTEDYRRRRRETLESLAHTIANKVKRTNAPISLEPMNPYERRVIHSTLKNDRYVSTYSEGEEPYRYVVVAPRLDQEPYDNSYRRPYDNSYQRPYKQRSYQNSYNNNYNNGSYNNNGYNNNYNNNSGYNGGSYNGNYNNNRPYRSGQGSYQKGGYRGGSDFGQGRGGYQGSYSNSYSNSYSHSNSYSSSSENAGEGAESNASHESGTSQSSGSYQGSGTYQNSGSYQSSGSYQNSGTSQGSGTSQNAGSYQNNGYQNANASQPSQASESSEGFASRTDDSSSSDV